MNNEECKENVLRTTTGVPEMLMAICEMLQRIEQKLDRDYYESEWMVVDKAAHGYGNARPVKVFSPVHVGGGGGHGPLHDIGACTYGPQGACGDACACTSGEKGMTEKK